MTLGRRLAMGWQALRSFCIRSFEDLPPVPADVIKLDDGLARPGGDQRLARQPVNCPPGITARHVPARHPDPSLRRQAQHAQVEQRVVQRAQRQAVGHHVRAVLAVPAHMRRL
jgi:hypothetical protein